MTTKTRIEKLENTCGTEGKVNHAFIMDLLEGKREPSEAQSKELDRILAEKEKG